MIVFEQSRKLWFQCGLRVEDFASRKDKSLNKVHMVVVLGSQFAFLVTSLIYTYMHVQQMELFQVAYTALQNQWASLSVSLNVSIHLVEEKIRKMLEVCQDIVDKSRMVFVASCLFGSNFLDIYAGAIGEARQFYEKAERNIYAVTRWPKFILQFNYLSSQALIYAAFVVRDYRRGHFDAANHYYMAHL